MATLIAVYNSDGCVGRCDANCYEARHAKCTCICRGMNHRAGLKQATRNVADRVGLRGADIEAFARDHDMQPGDLIAIDRLHLKDRRRARSVAIEQIERRKVEPDLFPE